jgi:acyl-CoA thioesterase
VHLHREPVGDWILVDARTTISAGGAGVATTTLSDRQGRVGTGAQALLIRKR